MGETLHQHHGLPPDPPTGREAMVLHLLAHGASRSAVADQLGCSPTTVDRVLQALREHYDVGTTVQAVVAAVRAGHV